MLIIPYLPLCSLILQFIGTGLVWWFGVPQKGYVTEDYSDKDERLGRVGIILIAAGFFIQIIIEGMRITHHF